MKQKVSNDTRCHHRIKSFGAPVIKLPESSTRYFTHTLITESIIWAIFVTVVYTLCNVSQKMFCKPTAELNTIADVTRQNRIAQRPWWRGALWMLLLSWCCFQIEHWRYSTVRVIIVRLDSSVHSTCYTQLVFLKIVLNFMLHWVRYSLSKSHEINLNIVPSPSAFWRNSNWVSTV